MTATPLLETRGVWQRFGGLIANSDVSISVGRGEIVGLIFDGNIESLVGDFVYEGVTNRAVAVHTGAMTEALSKLYGAQRIVDELLTGIRRLP